LQRYYKELEEMIDDEISVFGPGVSGAGGAGSEAVPEEDIETE
jgi:hypothetical protein